VLRIKLLTLSVLEASETWETISFRYSSRLRGMPPGGSDGGSSQVASLKMFENHRVRDRDGRGTILNEDWASSSVRITKSFFTWLVLCELWLSLDRAPAS
jgi:hypothetical protein